MQIFGMFSRLGAAQRIGYAVSNRQQPKARDLDRLGIREIFDRNN